MAGGLQRKSKTEFTGEMNINISKMLPLENEVVLLVNADMEVLGKIKKRQGNEKKGNTLTSSTSTSTSSTSTSTTMTSTSTS